MHGVSGGVFETSQQSPQFDAEQTPLELPGGGDGGGGGGKGGGGGGLLTYGEQSVYEYTGPTYEAAEHEQ